MKFHWGHGIFIFYVFFVSTLIFVVIKSRTFDNSLVDEHYYTRDLNYQQEYDRRANSLALTQPLELEHTEEGYELRFPADKSNVEGTLHLYRPSTRKDDRRLPLAVRADGTMLVPVTGMNPGYYEAIVKWSAGGVDYYDELDLTVQP